MKIKLFSTEVYISFLFTAVVALMLVTDRTGLVIPTLFAVLIHETAHLFAMWIMECAPKSIRLIPASVQIVRGFSPKPNGETAIALFGPIANLVVFVTLWLNFLVYGNEDVLRFAMLNLILGVFNLLPVKGLDGGTVMLNILSRRIDLYKAEGILRAITVVLGIAALVAGVRLVQTGNFNISAFITALYFLITALIKR